MMITRKVLNGAQENEFRLQVIGDVLYDAIEYISTRFHPSDVFEDCDLEEWAEEHGYVKEVK